MIIAMELKQRVTGIYIHGIIVHKFYHEHNIKAYIIGYEVFLTSKAVKHKLYGNLQLLPILTQL